MANPKDHERAPEELEGEAETAKDLEVDEEEAAQVRAGGVTSLDYGKIKVEYKEQ